MWRRATHRCVFASRYAARQQGAGSLSAPSPTDVSRRHREADVDAGLPLRRGRERREDKCDGLRLLPGWLLRTGVDGGSACSGLRRRSIAGDLGMPAGCAGRLDRPATVCSRGWRAGCARGVE
jgi:hypothetical protein